MSPDPNLEISVVDLHPAGAGAGYPVMRSLTLPPREPLSAPTAHSDRRRRERGAAHGDAAQAFRGTDRVRVGVILRLGCGLL